MHSKLLHLFQLFVISALVFTGGATTASALPSFPSYVQIVQSQNYVDPAEVAIGGVQIGSSMDYVRSIYGEPTTVRTYYDRVFYGNCEDWTYGDSFVIRFAQSGTAYSVASTKDNGIKTPAGFTVGQNINGVIDYFGSDKMTRTYDKTSGTYIYRVYCNSYIYLVFTTDKKGKISRISLVENP